MVSRTVSAVFLIWDSKVPVGVPAFRSSFSESWMLSVPTDAPSVAVCRRKRKKALKVFLPVRFHAP